MALSELNESTCSRHGANYAYVLYCHTCQLLLCPRCVSTSPVGEADHREHAYLDIRDACEAFKVSAL